MFSPNTELFLRSQLREARAAIADAQKAGRRCDLSVGVELNALRHMVQREWTGTGAEFEESVPRVHGTIKGGFSVAPTEALELHDALLAVLDSQHQRPGEKG